MTYIFRMLQLMFWHTAILKEPPSKVKQRVKLQPLGITATMLNPVMGSALECMGTVIKITKNRIFVTWDNNNNNAYSPRYLLIADFPLKFMPKFVRLGKNNPNITFKELESYKLMEKEWFEHEQRLKSRGNNTAEEAQDGPVSSFDITFGNR